MKLLLLAGEESGVLYAKRIEEAIRGREPSAEIRGYGDYGFEISDLAVIGFFAVLRKIRFFLRVKRTMERAIDEWKPDAVCTVDYPGMNLKLAAYAKKRGIRAVHVVCPQVWAWKKGRIPKIEASLDRLCCFFPFEPALFRTGFAEFVGHPLVDEMQDLAARGHKEGAEKVLAVLPGSRIGEIEKHMPVLLNVINSLCVPSAQPSSDRFAAASPGHILCGKIEVVIPAANERAYAKIESLFKCSAPGTSRPTVRVTHGGARETLRDADAAIVASGTATLEAALAGCPTVLVYRVGWLFAFLARRFIKGVRHLGLANIIAEKAGAPCPMPELLQENFTAANILRYVRPWLADPVANAIARKALGDTMVLLRSDGGAIGRIVTCLGV